MSDSCKSFLSLSESINSYKIQKSEKDLCLRQRKIDHLHFMDQTFVQNKLLFIRKY